MNQYFDIGANLTHPHFKNDLESVLYNAIEEGINKISITGSNIEESVQALKIAKKWPKL
jgi:TatD DNase family protein